MTHRAQIESKLRKDGFVDNFWCIDNKITTRLGAVIHVLKCDGWEFDDGRSGFLPNTKNWRYYIKNRPLTLEERRKRQIVIELPDGSVRVTYQ